MSREQVSAVTHWDLPFHDPLDSAAIDEVLALVELDRSDRVLDIGCGPGELLVRIAERFACGGVGVDLSESAIAEARRRAQRRAPAGKLEFHARDAKEIEGGGGFALTACMGSSHALGGLHPTLERLRQLTRPGGWVLTADGFWERPPSAEYLEALGATADELPDYGGLVRAGQAHGLVPVYVATSSRRDWDRYEWRLILNGERWAVAHPDHALVPELRDWVERARRRYTMPGGRDTLGFALILHRRP